MVERRKPIQIGEAVSLVMGYKLKRQKESVSLIQSSGRYLAESIVADHDVPPFDRSPYDGYAIRADDTKDASRENPAKFVVVGEIGAGTVYEQVVGPGEAVRIMTGAKIPAGCDAVVMLEIVRETKHGEMELVRKIKRNDNISFQGEDTKKSTLITNEGTYIHPGIVAQLATFGYASVAVAKKPRVGILATGSELLEVNQPLSPGKIRNSNAYMVAAQVIRAGAEPVMYGQLPDDLDQCVNVISTMLNEVDVLVTTGGASVGDFDLVPGIIERFQAKLLFNKVAMRPGSVTTAAVIEDKVFFGLSGNPGACFVGFELFIRPLIRQALFANNVHLEKSKGRLGVDFPKPNPFTRLVRGRLEEEEGTHIVYPSGLDKSGSVGSLAEADLFIILPGGTRGYEQGMEVDLLLLESQKGSDSPWEKSSK